MKLLITWWLFFVSRLSWRSRELKERRCLIGLANVELSCRFSSLIMAWQRSIATTEHDNIYRTVRTRTWRARLGMQALMLTSALSRVDVTTWNHWAMYLCTSTVAHCRGKDLRLQRLSLFCDTRHVMIIVQERNHHLVVNSYVCLQN